VHEFRKLVFIGEGANEVGSPGILATIQGHTISVPCTLNKRCYIFPLSKSYQCTGLDRLLELQEVETPRISRRSTHENGKVVSPPHGLLTPRDIPDIQIC
jgi:hypothetical protein